VYPTRDGLVLIAANQDTVFARLALAMGEPELAKDPRFATHQARGARQAELDAHVGRWTSSRSTREVLEILAQRETAVPSGLIYRAPEMLEDEHFKAREAIVSTTHPLFGRLQMQNVAPKLSATPGRVRAPAPEMGQHNDEVYRDLLGLSAESLAGLKARRVV
jgi:crotonobetainyl-CoA:carnitine CoA-transferase CaiB-like acyl-CoA transferase